jgi:hypothetical protein
MTGRASSYEAKYKREWEISISRWDSRVSPWCLEALRVVLIGNPTCPLRTASGASPAATTTLAIHSRAATRVAGAAGAAAGGAAAAAATIPYWRADLVWIVSRAVVDIESKGRIVQVVSTGNLDQRAGTATSTA